MASMEEAMTILWIAYTASLFLDIMFVFLLLSLVFSKQKVEIHGNFD